jgi:hypothetical protein
MSTLGSPARRFRGGVFALFPVLALILLCSGEARSDTFTAGDFVTFGQTEWVSDPTAITILETDFNTIYASTGGVLEVGIPGAAGFSILLSSASAVQSYLPASGTDGPLNTDLLDPTSTSSGTFGGDVVALALDVDFSTAGLLPGTSPLHFSDLYLTGFGGTSLADLQGMTVTEFLALNETELGGGTTAFTIADLQLPLEELNDAFVTGAVTTFATDHLTETNPGGNPTPTPEPSSLLLLASGLLPLGIFRYRQRRHGERISGVAA